MAQYKVLVGVRPRSAPTVTTNDTAVNIPANTLLNSVVSQVDSITSSHPTMIMIADGTWAGKWVPLIYLGLEYVKIVDTTPTPPPTPTGKPFTLTVTGFKPFTGTLIPEA